MKIDRDYKIKTIRELTCNYFDISHYEKMSDTEIDEIFFSLCKEADEEENFQIEYLDERIEYNKNIGNNSGLRRR